MSAVSDRARSLARIAAVQAEMVKLAEWKLAAARRDRDALEEERRLLATFVGGEEALGAGVARAALRTARGIEIRIAQVEDAVGSLESQLRSLRRRDKAVTGMAGEARQAARREDEAVALGQTMEAWLARASLP